MNKTLLGWFALALGAGCPSADIDDNEGVGGPLAEFDPSNRVIPFPNNLLLDPATGKVKLPPGCDLNGGVESASSQATRELVLNQLDGFATFKTTINITFTEPVDVASMTDRVVVYKIAAKGVPVDPATSDALPTLIVPGITVRFDADCANPKMVDQVTIVPLVPLDGSSTYTVGIVDGVQTAAGGTFLQSTTWGFVRSVEPVVEFDDAGIVVSNLTPLDPSTEAGLAQLQGLDLLWKAHANGLAFLAAKGHAHNTIVLGQTFNTETIHDPLDPAVVGSPAAAAATTPALAGVDRINAAANGEQFLTAVLPIGTCTQLPCNAVDEALSGATLGKQFQIDTPNPLTGGAAIPGPWGDPNTPAEVKTSQLGTVILTAKNCPVAGCPTVIYGHGFTRQKEDIFAIGPQLAAAGFNTISIDFVGHGARAVRNSDSAALGCSGTPSFGAAPQCFAPFFTTVLSVSRDNFRQSVIDVESLVAAVKACGTTNCNQLKVDPTKTVYLGQSLGSILGGMIVANTDVNAAVLNVAGAGWIDLLANTNELRFVCPLVDALIDSGTLVGDKFDPTTGTGLCVGDEWKTQPGFRQFSVIGGWALDPGDPVNFLGKLAAKKVLIQRVDNDQVVPNVTTDTEGALLGLTTVAADCGNAAAPAPSAALLTDPTQSKLLNYLSVAPGTAACTPGNTFGHGSLLAPTPRCETTTTTVCSTSAPVGRNGCPNNEACNAPAADSNLAVARMQTDAITYLVNNR